MKFRSAVFVVVYAKSKGKIYYLILRRKLHWKGWEFPKGGMEFFETKKGAVKREIREETGLKVLKIKKFNEKGKFKYNKKFPDRVGFVGQKYSLYSAEVKKEKIKLDKREHFDYRWLDFNDAVKKLSWANQRSCLRIVNASLQSQKT